MLKILLSLVVLLGLACGKVDEPGPEEQVTGIVGTWQGVQKIINPESMQETNKSVELIVYSDGRFELREAETGRSAFGVYEHFSRLQALTFRFSESTMTDFALAGSIFNFEYDLQGQELLLRAQRVVFWLKRKTLEPKPVDQLNGSWTCREPNKDGQGWQLTIAATEFTMISRRPGQAALLLRGLIEWPSGIDLDEETPVLGRWIVREAQPIRLFEGFEARIEWTGRGDDRQILLSLFPWVSSDSQASDYYLVCEK